jgi:hypothetical protein
MLLHSCKHKISGIKSVIYLCVNTKHHINGRFTCRFFESVDDAKNFYNIRYELRDQVLGKIVNASWIIEISTKYDYKDYSKILVDELKDVTKNDKITIDINTD